MKTALRAMQPWRRQLEEYGLTFEWLAERTEKSVDTVQAYSIGRRNPSSEWLDLVDELIAEYAAEHAA